MTHTETLKLACKALTNAPLVTQRMDEAVDAIEAALAQPEQEPVTHQYQGRTGEWHNFMNPKHYEATVKEGSWPIRALYTTPPQRTWVGLTPEQIQHRIDTHIGVPSPKYPLDNSDLINFALVIADELKGKNT